MSDVIDEEPKPKRRIKGTTEPKKKGEPKKRGPKPSKSEDVDPEAEEIRRLQGWLVKCGIRKVWGRELKSHETPKEKIRHLKGMLSETGMTGRYSIEKANQIRETRELHADLEAVQEGAKRWGKASDAEEEAVKRRPRNRPVIEDFEFDSD